MQSGGPRTGRPSGHHSGPLDCDGELARRDFADGRTTGPASRERSVRDSYRHAKGRRQPASSEVGPVRPDSSSEESSGRGRRSCPCSGGEGPGPNEQPDRRGLPRTLYPESGGLALKVMTGARLSSCDVALKRAVLAVRRLRPRFARAGLGLQPASPHAGAVGWAAQCVAVL